MPWYDLHEQKVISEKEAQTLHRHHGPGRVLWRDDCEDWELADKQTLIFGVDDFNILLTTEIQPFTTLKEYLQAKAMTEATRRYENSPELCKHLTMLQAGIYDFECSRHMFLYTQHFMAYYRKPLPAPPPAPEPLPEPAPEPLPPLALLRNPDANNISSSTGGSSLTRSQRHGAHGTHQSCSSWTAAPPLMSTEKPTHGLIPIRIIECLAVSQGIATGRDEANQGV